MLRTVSDRAKATVSLSIEGESVLVPCDLSVAAALMLHGRYYTRTTAVSGVQRAPYCMMGVCFDCLVEIDDVPNVQGCMTIVQDGMAVRRQQGKRTLPSR
jgi:predicted molibdopterin-dependent oxidoreductase YjgC